MILSVFLLLAFPLFSLANQSVLKASKTQSLVDQQDSDFSVKSLTIGGDYGESPFILFSGSSSSFEMLLRAESGTFEMGHTDDEDGAVVEVTLEKSVFFNAQSVDVKTLNIRGSLFIDGIQQWRLISQEGFWTTPEGWSQHEVTKCGGAFLLGGYCKTSSSPLYKVFRELPEHSMIRLVSTFHFIDEWTGETAFLKVDMGTGGADYKFLWTDRYSPETGFEGPDVCGLPFGEAKFSVPIDVTTPHDGSEITVFFGTSLVSSPCEASYGISNFQIYVR